LFGKGGNTRASGSATGSHFARAAVEIASLDDRGDVVIRSVGYVAVRVPPPSSSGSAASTANKAATMTEGAGNVAAINAGGAGGRRGGGFGHTAYAGDGVGGGDVAVERAELSGAGLVPLGMIAGLRGGELLLVTPVLD
jgi:hypothetical protein